MEAVYANFSFKMLLNLERVGNYTRNLLSLPALFLHPQVEKSPTAVPKYVKPSTPLQIYMDGLRKSLIDSDHTYARAIAEGQKNFGRIVYQGSQPSCIYSLLDVRYNLGRTLARAQLANLRLQEISLSFLNRLDDQDIFSIPIRGVTLRDIEQLPRPVDEQGIETINRLFCNMFLPWPREPKVVSNIRQIVLFTATQKTARPEARLVIPPRLQALHDRLTDYLDYYLDLLKDNSMSGDEASFFMYFLSRKRPWLQRALALHAPARLGITPSSASKLYRQVVANTGFPEKLYAKLVGEMDRDTQFNFRSDILPPQLHKYVFYDKENEKRAERLFRQEVEGRNGSPEDQPGHVEQLVGRLRLYRKLLQSDVLGSNNRRFDFDLSDGVVASRMMVTSQYRDSLIFVLLFNDPQNTHLTLDLGRDGNLYGLPPRLAVDNPHLAEQIIAQLLMPVLGHMKVLHPQIEPAHPILPKKPPEIWEDLPTPIKKRTKREPTSTKVTVNGIKNHPRVLAPLAQYFANLDSNSLTLPKPHQEVKRQSHVRYSRELVRSQLGRNCPEKVISQVMRDLKEFEFGRRSVDRKLEDMGDLWEIRSGDYRIILENIGNGFYNIHAIGDRKDIFTRRGILARH